MGDRGMPFPTQAEVDALSPDLAELAREFANRWRLPLDEDQLNHLEQDFAEFAVTVAKNIGADFK